MGCSVHNLYISPLLRPFPDLLWTSKAKISGLDGTSSYERAGEKDVQGDRREVLRDGIPLVIYQDGNVGLWKRIGHCYATLIGL